MNYRNKNVEETEIERRRLREQRDMRRQGHGQGRGGGSALSATVELPVTTLKKIGGHKRLHDPASYSKKYDNFMNSNNTSTDSQVMRDYIKRQKRHN